NLYRDVLIHYPTSPEASQATARLKALGGKIPDPSEIHPAPPPEEAKFVRAPKPKYASQAKNREALNQAIGGMGGGAMSQPASPPAAEAATAAGRPTRPETRQTLLTRGEAPLAAPDPAARLVWGPHAAVTAIVLVLLVAAAFYPCLSNDFVSWDDQDNFLENP